MKLTKEQAQKLRKYIDLKVQSEVKKYKASAAPSDMIGKRAKEVSQMLNADNNLADSVIREVESMYNCRFDVTRNTVIFSFATETPAEISVRITTSGNGGVAISTPNLAFDSFKQFEDFGRQMSSLAGEVLTILSEISGGSIQ